MSAEIARWSVRRPRPISIIHWWMYRCIVLVHRPTPSSRDMPPVGVQGAAIAAVMPFISGPTKRLIIIRHGQAMHNPRAENARAEGCSHARFMEIMRQDDCFDSPLTALGKQQAREGEARFGRLLQSVDLVVSSPLSRAVETADIMLPPPALEESPQPPHSIDAPSEVNATHSRSFATSSSLAISKQKRIVLENLREINGWLLNAKRRERSDLEKRFHSSWDFSQITEKDETWTEELESQPDCAERGYRSLLSLAQRPERSMVVVAHGGLLRFTMNQHPKVSVLDGRNGGSKGDARCVKSRFGNCEMRAFDMKISVTENVRDAATEADIHELRPEVILTEVDLEPEIPN